MARGFSTGVTALVCGTLMAFASTSLAAPVSTLQIGDPSLSLGSTAVDFLPAGGGTGTFSVGGASTGTFASLPGTSGTIKDLNFTVQPINSAFVLSNAFTLAAAPTLAMDLTFIHRGVATPVQCAAAPAAGQICTVVVPALVTAANPTGLSPVTFANTAKGSIATFSLSGVARDASGAESTTTVTVTTQFADQNFQSVLATLAGGGTTAPSSFSATVKSSGNGPNGTLQVGQPTLSLSANGIDFRPPTGGPNGTFLAGAGSNGIFAPANGTSGALLDLSNASQPPNTPILLANFLTLAAFPTHKFDLTFIDPGVFGSAQCFAAPAAGQTCTLASGFLSALNFINTPTGAAAWLALHGVFDDIATPGDQVPFDAIITMQFDGSYQNVLATLVAGGTVEASYSASFTIGATAVPEPPALMIALGMLALMRLATRRRQ